MGLFDFVRGAGKKIFGDPEEEARKAAAEAAAEAHHQRLIGQRRARSLSDLISSMGFEVDAMAVSVTGETATISGQTADQATREKVVLLIGNVEGISRVDDRIEVVAAEPEAQFYTVVSGDTLGRIAKQLYGRSSKYPVIFEANRPMLEDPDKIYPGQVLRIPPQDED